MIIRSSRVLGDVAAATALGVHAPAGIEADFGAVMERMRRLRARISHHDSVERPPEAVAAFLVSVNPT